MPWIENQNPYDIVWQNWIVDCFKMYKISDNIIKFIDGTMKNRRAEIIAEEKVYVK